MSTLASALPAEGEGGFASGRPLWDPAPGKRYAALFAAWGKDCYWEAEVVEDEHGPRVVSVVEFPEAPGASDRVQFERTDVKTVADAIQLAERLRDEAVEQRWATDGPPTRVDMVIEESGQGERMEALKRARSWWPGRRPEPKQYALLVARWRAIEWVAAVVEDDLGLRVVHLHNPGCSDGSCGIDTTRPSWAVADAVLLAEKKRDEMVAACLPYWGRPDSIDTVVEPTGDTERFEARIQAGRSRPGRQRPRRIGLTGWPPRPAWRRSWPSTWPRGRRHAWDGSLPGSPSWEWPWSPSAGRSGRTGRWSATGAAPSPRPAKNSANDWRGMRAG